MRQLKTLICTLIALSYFLTLDAQGIFRRLERAVNNTTGNNSNNNTNNSAPGTPGSSSSNGSNNGGEGLISTPPDVKENLSSAESAFKNGKYGDARFAVQQAMLGVELEIGHQILKSLPETIDTLKKDTTQDRVASNGYGWAGLTIMRKYQTGNKHFQITIANNSAWMNALNLYFNNIGYAQSDNDRQKMKQIMVKGNKSIIEFDPHSGYKISIPIGQTSLLILEGVNFETEKEMMSATNEIDIDGIKEKLGEK
jgi:hypothetical protein